LHHVHEIVHRLTSADDSHLLDYTRV